MIKPLSFLLIVFSCSTLAAQSTCYGTTANGSLQQGVKLPADGKNYVGYSRIARISGRTYVHSKVKAIVVDAYKLLEAEQPNKVFKYAETGFAEGGEFKPHKTHRNGLSVDFMTPVIDESGQSVHLPTHPFNKFGYEIEFDSKDRFEEFQLDYVALAAHIVALHKSAKQHGVDLWRVIFDPKLQPKLFATSYGEYLQQHIQFSKRRSWVRHDEHYHVDFAIQCQELSK
ncbi:replication initiation protein [Thalassotalea litorea]|uniref:Replication initiation protein n=1 Tax=Thalassotalea litorea TaxID=2020715 RepID=A0A5R9IJJ5_9GAMM|nr:penicillin-insensitive murein endopeptidase [Thalassotalea litorea]TLU65695.1 replication initiation protein [Thalassotalea litorea]